MRVWQGDEGCHTAVVVAGVLWLDYQRPEVLGFDPSLAFWSELMPSAPLAAPNLNSRHELRRENQMESHEVNEVHFW